VINLAMADHPEALPGAEQAFADAGVAYTHIPVPFDAPREEHYRAFVRALEAAEGPVHVHCIANWRVSAFFYRYNRACGMPEPEARALMERQWSPERSDHPDAPAWVRFIGEQESCWIFTGSTSSAPAGRAGSGSSPRNCWRAAGRGSR